MWMSSRWLALVALALLALGVVLGLTPLYLDARSNWSLVRPSLGYSCGSAFFGRQEPIGLHTLIIVEGFRPCAGAQGRMSVFSWGLIWLGLMSAATSMVAWRVEKGFRRDQLDDKLPAALP